METEQPDHQGPRKEAFTNPWITSRLLPELKFRTTTHFLNAILLLTKLHKLVRIRNVENAEGVLTMTLNILL